MENICLHTKSLEYDDQPVRPDCFKTCRLSTCIPYAETLGIAGLGYETRSQMTRYFLRQTGEIC